MSDNERLAGFWTHVDDDPRVERIEVKENLVRWKIITNVRSVEEVDQLRADLVERSGLQPDQFEILFH